jgi:uncharacterized membrane protein (DUF2068 family)
MDGGTVAGVTPPDTPAPATLRLAVGLLLLEALAVAIVAGILVYKDLTAAGAGSRAIGVTGFAVVMAVLPAVLGWSLWRRRAWARGPAVFLELMMLPIGWYMIAGGLAWAGVPVFVLSLVGAGLLIAPATREALGMR